MEIKAHAEFFKSLKRIIDTKKPWKLMFWRHNYLDFKRSLWALRKYFKITTKMVPWDYGSVLEMMKFQIEILSNYIEKDGIEIDKDRLPKVERMKRFIELADNQLEDNYFDRCNFLYKDMKFIPVEGDSNLVELKFDKTDEEKEHNHKAIKNAHELEEKEWNEMIELLKDMRSWWD